ncbi:DUF4231 domain-containing protein [Streptomyces sp. SL13]|uniref:DUF4231 domain-containing protein n=1 Tax=Streptantibioticus silvisoli TaxID=2705255 RepID=A0AA90H2V1_9ACTN|nr:DUF4231 domain-containing protein [Streptantibioticus silvisoli]MDI5967850.1 DUF4231 domain-containing protein [Streptantibioticus silvisoli]
MRDPRADEPSSTEFRNADLPRLFHDTDRAAVSRQKDALRWVRRQLAMLLIAAGCSALPWRLPVGRVDLLALASAAGYVGALWYAWQAARYRHRAKWQLHRSAAELLRSQCWRYAVGGAPFGPGVADPDSAFAFRITESLTQLRAAGWQAPVEAADPVPAPEMITPAMRALRDKPFTVRRGVYVRDRLMEQRDWYRRRSGESRRSLALWQALSTLSTAVALAAAAAKIFEWGSSMDLAGLASSIAASGVAWSEVRQYRPLIAAHARVAQELSAMEVTLRKETAEARWAAGVESAEEAISPERTAWLTRHGE